MNMLQALNKSVSFVKKVTNQSKIESKIEAEHIFMYVLQIDKNKLYEQYNTYLSDEDSKKIEDILELRKNKPLSYIINKHTFYKDEFHSLKAQVDSLFLKLPHYKKWEKLLFY